MATMEILRGWAHMLWFGFASFNLTEPRPLNIRTARRKFLTAAERWQLLGNRLRSAAEKVVGQNEHEQ